MRGLSVSSLLLVVGVLLCAAGVSAESSRADKDAGEQRENRRLKVRIVSPGRRGSVDSGTIVRGVIEAPAGAEVGVTVNGQVAEVSGASFAFYGLTPQLAGGEDGDEGHEAKDGGHEAARPYRILVKALDSAGNKASDKLELAAAEPFRVPAGLSANPTSGTAPLAVTFAVGDAALAGATLLELDYEGDGVVDAAAPTLAGLAGALGHSYGADGIYTPTLRVTDGAGAKSARSIVVNVFRVPDLKKKWGTMNAALLAGDVEQAATYFAAPVRDSYRRAFLALADAGGLIQAAAGMGDIEIVRTGGDTAEGDLRVVRNGREYSHAVFFVRDADGIWRIRAF